MGLFSGLFHNKKKQSQVPEPEKAEILNTSWEEKPAKPTTAAEVLQAVEESKEQRREAGRQLSEARMEYEAVTSYLTDIQKIELVPAEEKKTFLEAAEKLVLFKAEREKYRSQEINLSEKHRQRMEQYEDSVPSELKKLQENEEYQSVIKNDMRHLEGEKGALSYEREEIKEKQDNLKKLAITCAILVAILIALLAALERAFETSMAVPFLLTVVMGVASAAYIVVESRNNRRNMALANKKLSRAIGLLNTVKVKYVNNTACIEYTYEKLGVESSMELEYIWGQYVKLKERERQFRSTTEKINEYNQILVSELQKYAISDAEVWTYQPEALLDSKEMVEVRHRLNVRRQKLRDQMDYNNKTIEYHTGELTKLQKEWPELSISFEEI